MIEKDHHATHGPITHPRYPAPEPSVCFNQYVPCAQLPCMTPGPSVYFNQYVLYVPQELLTPIHDSGTFGLFQPVCPRLSKGLPKLARKTFTIAPDHLVTYILLLTCLLHTH
jgi:hypothetical protein